MNKLFFLPIAAILTAALPVRAASNCDAVAAAAMKVFQVPAHLYMTQMAVFTGGKSKNSESVYLNGAIFVMVGGKWVKSSVSPKDLSDSKKESDQKLGVCSVVRDEAVSGEPATLYKVHNQTPDDTVDTQIWVSKLRGLPLKQINDMDVGGARGKSHTEIRYEYTNVTAPAVSESGRK
jgi:hypothetical protein